MILFESLSFSEFSVWCVDFQWVFNWLKCFSIWWLNDGDAWYWFGRCGGVGNLLSNLLWLFSRNSDFFDFQKTSFQTKIDMGIPQGWMSVPTQLSSLPKIINSSRKPQKHNNWKPQSTFINPPKKITKLKRQLIGF